MDHDIKPWPHQERGVRQTLAEIEAGCRRICVTAPTGTGKTAMMLMLADHYARQSRPVIIYTNRRLLLEQTMRVMAENGFEFGVRAAGHGRDPSCPLQVSSLPTERARVLKAKTWELHDADLVITDEQHANNNPTAHEILGLHHAAGAACVGFTATPIGLGDICDKLIVACNVSEGRACGALVPAICYGPDEPDLRHIGKIALGEELSENQNRKAMGAFEDGRPNMKLTSLFGRVLKWFDILNPDRKPTILFAPGVKESVWFAEQFTRAGIPAAHIDGQEVWSAGEFKPTSSEARADILQRSQNGSCCVLCNRFVLREGIDAPWLCHVVLGTVFGSLQGYLQSCGRLLRSHHGIENVSIQDHGGNWWRWGSVNADREWRLDMTAAMAAGLHQEAMRRKKPDEPDPEPVRCPSCAMILKGRICRCGYEIKVGMKSRPVVMEDGTLRLMQGDIYAPRVEKRKANTEEIWRKCYYRCKNTGKTFNQAVGLFVHENHYWPPRDLPLMPTAAHEWYLKIEDVPKERLMK